MAEFSNDADPKIIDLILAHSDKEPWRALEFFPPRTPQGVDNLKSRMPRMKAEAKPLYADITWGAGGTTRCVGQSIKCSCLFRQKILYGTVRGLNGEVRLPVLLTDI
jgi:5,10-methylenetetrahydrofolate reductase